MNLLFVERNLTPIKRITCDHEYRMSNRQYATLPLKCPRNKVTYTEVHESYEYTCTYYVQYKELDYLYIFIVLLSPISMKFRTISGY